MDEKYSVSACEEYVRSVCGVWYVWVVCVGGVGVVCVGGVGVERTLAWDPSVSLMRSSLKAPALILLVSSVSTLFLRPRMEWRKKRTRMSMTR